MEGFELSIVIKRPTEEVFGFLANLALKTAFDALTPGRQRAYILYFPRVFVLGREAQAVSARNADAWRGPHWKEPWKQRIHVTKSLRSVYVA